VASFGIECVNCPDQRESGGLFQILERDPTVSMTVEN
jgi:hypothetical protein